MKEENKEENKTFLKTNVNYALVIRADVNTVSEIKNYIGCFGDVEVIYQRYSFNKLLIVEEGDIDESQ